MKLELRDALLWSVILMFAWFILWGLLDSLGWS